jgi:tetratricopeptide (TPR) repeat protein
MDSLHLAYPKDNEATILYALALTAAADPTDKTLAKQKQAGDILMALYREEPNHPGIIHYIIHTYDYPELAALALPAARKYAAVAPSSAHALHMPSHIFTRLGLWDECIRANQASISSAKCYAEQTGIKGHWDEELHGLDYLVYAYLQKGEDRLAKEQLDYLKTIDVIYPANFKVAYAFAAIPARCALESKDWRRAVDLPLYHANIQWQNFPWQEAIYHFTRTMGLAHFGHLDTARAELDLLKAMHAALLAQKDGYKANQVLIQVRTAEAWIALKEGKTGAALDSMRLAADMEDRTEKHPVTPCEVIPARELLGDMLLEANKPREALDAYQADLQRHPNRWNGLYGAGLAAQRSGMREKAREYFQQLERITDSVNADRPALADVRKLLARG